MPDKKKNTKKINSLFSRLNREFLVFLVFLLIAVGLWFIQTFKDAMSMSVDYRINLLNIPKSLIVTSEIPEEVNIRVSGKGFELLRMLFSSKEKVVDVDYRNMKKSEKTLLIDSDIWKRAFDKVLPRGVSVSERSLPTTELYYSKGEHKMVPVVFDGKVITKSNDITSDVSFLPDSVKIYAPQALLDTISFIKTENVSFEGGDSTLHETVKLDLPLGVKSDLDQVRVAVSFEWYLLKSEELPVLSKNCPPNIFLKFFPSKVTVKYKVKASMQNKVKNEFKDCFAVVDYDSIKNDSKYCSVSLVSVPKDVTVKECSDPYVGYVIEPIHVSEE